MMLGRLSRRCNMHSQLAPSWLTAGWPGDGSAKQTERPFMGEPKSMGCGNTHTDCSDAAANTSRGTLTPSVWACMP